LSISKQCDLLSLSKGVLYYEPVKMDAYNHKLMEMIDKQYLKTPFYGSRKMVIYLTSEGYFVNRKRVQRLMRLMNIQAVYPKPNLSKNRQEHKIYPYLLKGVKIDRPNFVWSTDITYIPVSQGFLYLAAIIDWYSRYVLSWRLSNTLDVTFCIDALEEALDKGCPGIFNSDQGPQFTSNEFTERLLSKEIKISMDGRGRVFDNIFIERLWRTVKYEDVYLKGYETGKDVKEGLSSYFPFYNNERFHQALGYRTPKEVYYN
jgi:putative transposase